MLFNTSWKFTCVKFNGVRVNCSKSICSNLDCSTLFFKMSTARQKNIDCSNQVEPDFVTVKCKPNLTYSVLLPNCHTCSRLSIFYNSSSWHLSMLLSSSCNSSSCSFWSKTRICSKWRFFDFRAVFIFLTSARTVSSSRDFGVKQFYEQMNFEQLTLLHLMHF